MRRPEQMHHRILYGDPHAYCSHPCATVTKNGDILVVFNESLLRVPYRHPPSDPRFYNLMIRSRDGGETWDSPRVVPNYDWYGVECPGITTHSDGTVLLNQWRFLWYPLELGRKLHEQGKAKCYVNTAGRRFHQPESENEWAASQDPFVRANGGVFVHRSLDSGHTWEEGPEIDVSPHIGGFTKSGAVELPNGDMLLALGDHPANRFAYLIRSRDSGRSWLPPIPVGSVEGDGATAEPHLACLPSGKLVLMARNDDSGYLHQSDSFDGGETWTPFVRTPMWGCPPHLLLLSDGRLLLTYGHRRAPFGIRACLSHDEGASWQIDDEIIIRDDLPNRNLGYPATLELSTGELLTVYYGEDAAGTTCIQSSSYRV